MHISDAVVNTSHYEYAGPSLIPDKGSRRTAQPAVHPPMNDNGSVIKVDVGESIVW